MDPIKTFIHQPIFTAMLVLAVVVFGVFAYPKIGVDQFPDVDFPVVTVTTVLPGADPETVENNVSQPLEEGLNTLSGVETLRSVNVESVSQIIVQFSLDKNVNIAAQDVRDRVQATLSKLPKEANAPVVEKFDIGAAPILTLAVNGPLPIQEITRLSKDVVKPALQRKQGVGGIDLVGGQEREIQVVVDPGLLRTYGVSISDVTQALRAQSVDIPGGRTSEPGAERVVKLEGEARSVDALRNLIIASPAGAPVRIRDVANVVDGPQEARSAATFNGQHAVALVVRKQSGSNTVQVAHDVMESLSEITALLPKGVKVETVTDGSKFIRSSISAVQEDMLLGGILAVVIVLVFLRNWRSTLVSAVALPTSVIGTFAVMQALHFTFNVVTMLALTLSIGLLIDDAIVVIENIIRHMEEGATPFKAAYEGTKEIALAVLAVTLSIVAVFIPVAFMEGMMGKFFYQFGVTVAVAVGISYFVSMTLTPMLSSRLLKHHGEPGIISRGIEGVLTGIENVYRRALRWMLDHRAITMATAVGVLFLTLFLARFINFTFIPAQDMSMAKVTVEMPVGTPLERTQQELGNVRAQLEKLPGVASVYTSAGGGVQEEVHKGELMVNLVPLAQRAYGQQDFKQYVRQNIVRSAGVNLNAQDYSAVSGGGARAQPVQFNIRGDNWKEVIAAAEKTKAAMKQQPGFVDVDLSYRSGKPQLSVDIDRERAASVGVPAAMLGTMLRSFLGGDAVIQYREGGDTFDVKVKLPPEVLADPDQVGALTVRTPMGQLVELRSVADIRPDEGPSQIDRQAQKRQITVLAELRNYSLGEAIGFLNGFAKKELPPTVTTDFEGQGKELAKAGLAFVMALFLGIILVYMILAAQFGSLLDPITIMMSLPFAVIGALGGLLISNQYMSMFAMIGIIMLMGLVTKNGILLVDFTNQLRAQGKSTRDALLEAGPIRLRPILMTTIAMIAGMIPVAMARGDGAETRVPMAIAIIGGLTTSTLLTLGVVPVFYSLVDGLRRRVVGQRPADTEAPAAELHHKADAA
ncbi:MAG: efflux RND transporter permease subunit [Hyalangium sp.]|uniref:efflux RND transporter permease subunit n=1 Tax=Hyalangium sp. TaxID=2028555 RepID=UPI00389ACD63